MIESADVKFTKDGSTITVKATNAMHPKRLEHTLEQCKLKHKSHSINRFTADGETTTIVVVTYDNIKLSGSEPEDSKNRASLDEAMARVVDALK